MELAKNDWKRGHRVPGLNSILWKMHEFVYHHYRNHS